jgi:CrcB protein
MAPSANSLALAALELAALDSLAPLCLHLRQLHPIFEDTTMKLVWLMLAGALGTVARYGLTLGVHNWLSGRSSGSLVAGTQATTFPLGTLVVNVVGSLLLAFIATLALHEMVKPELRLILGTGFLGAFTTFSTFELESENLLSSGQWAATTLYIGGNLLLGFGAIFLGRAIALRVLA